MLRDALRSFGVNQFLWILLITLGSCGGGGGHSSSDIHTVQYEVSTYSTYPVSIMYTDENGKTIEIQNKYVTDIPWTYTFSAKTGTHLFLSATLLGESDDIFYVTITVDYVNVSSYSQKGSGGPAVLEFAIPPR